MSLSNIAVIDIGKTNAKLALVDPISLTEVAVKKTPNIVQDGPPWPHFDIDGIWSFLVSALQDFHSEYGIGAITITTHGAAIVLLDDQGELAAPVLDYEFAGPDTCREEYEAIRPPFSQTGSPALAGGLNIGSQLFWQFKEDPSLHTRTKQILTYPQYWAYRLTGVTATEVTSLGCHSDLWEPKTGQFSKLVDKLEIRNKFAKRVSANAIQGTLLPEVSAQTKLPQDLKVTSGIHDSNASILPYLTSQKKPFSVISTGTWVIVMAVGGKDIALSEDKDTLLNVNAHGHALPSARFMGGREFELLGGEECPEPTHADIECILAQGVMITPAVVPETGPFQGKRMRWVGKEPAKETGERAAVIGFYLALVTARSLKLIGAQGPIFVEGSFARNSAFLAILSAATKSEVFALSSETGTSIGAASLVSMTNHEVSGSEVKPISLKPEKREMHKRYAKKWFRLVQ